MAKRTNREAQIGQCVFEPTNTTRIAAFFFETLSAMQGGQGEPPGLSGRRSVRNSTFDFAVHIVAQFVFELAFEGER